MKRDRYEVAHYTDLAERHKAKYILSITRNKNMIIQTKLISTPIVDSTHYKTLSVNLSTDVLNNDV